MQFLFGLSIAVFNIKQPIEIIFLLYITLPQWFKYSGGLRHFTSYKEELFDGYKSRQWIQSIANNFSSNSPQQCPDGQMMFQTWPQCHGQAAQRCFAHHSLNHTVLLCSAHICGQFWRVNNKQINLLIIVRQWLAWLILYIIY